MCVLAIDIGASFIKGARVYPESGEIEPSIRRGFPGFASVGARRREVPTAKILTAVWEVIEELLQDGRPARSLFICGQMHGLVLVSADGNVLSNFSSWQDERSLENAPGHASSCFSSLAERLGPEIIQQTGNELRPGLPVAQLHAMRLNNMLQPGTVPLSLPDYVALALCQSLQRPVTDLTNAAAHGMLDVARGSWHADGIARAGLEKLTWPRIVSTGAEVGQFRCRGQEITVHLPVGDQQAALLGAELEDGELSLNVATGSQVSMLTSQSNPGAWQLRPFFGDRRLRTVTHLPAGRALNALVLLLGELASDQGTPLVDPWSRIEHLAAQASEPQMSVSLSFFPSSVGELGSISELMESELRVGPLFRAAFRSMARNYLDAARRISPQGWRRLVFSGGLLHKSAALRREILSALKSEFRFAPHAEDTLYGLLRLAQMAS